uniref:Uncharacterized protein n=1 Tax=Anguilla anguilla TaxID=7936 RepID=A0A0E9S2S2_ANGAN
MQVLRLFNSSTIEILGSILDTV